MGLMTATTVFIGQGIYSDVMKVPDYQSPEFLEFTDNFIQKHEALLTEYNAKYNEMNSFWDRCQVKLPQVQTRSLNPFVIKSMEKIRVGIDQQYNLNIQEVKSHRGFVTVNMMRNILMQRVEKYGAKVQKSIQALESGVLAKLRKHVATLTTIDETSEEASSTSK